MSRHSPELFSRDLKYLVNTESPLKKRRSGTHSHIFATVAIAIVVAVWLGGDPSASIDTDSPRSRGLTAAAPVKKAGEEADRAADPFDRGQTAFDASVLYDFENDAAAFEEWAGKAIQASPNAPIRRAIPEH